MENNSCYCANNKTVEYLCLEYNCKHSQRWLCQKCFENQQNQKFTYNRNRYINYQEAMKQFDVDVQNFKRNRKHLLKHLYQLFDEYPFQYEYKQQISYQLNQIQKLFIGLINRPFNEYEQEDFEGIISCLSDPNKFNKLKEEEIRKILSIGRGHYQCDNSKVSQILIIMSQIEDMKSSSLFLNLKLIVKQSDQILFCEKEFEKRVVVSSLCIDKSLLYCTTYLKDKCCFKQQKIIIRGIDFYFSQNIIHKLTTKVKVIFIILFQ